MLFDVSHDVGHVDVQEVDVALGQNPTGLARNLALFHLSPKMWCSDFASTPVWTPKGTKSEYPCHLLEARRQKPTTKESSKDMLKLYEVLRMFEPHHKPPCIFRVLRVGPKRSKGLPTHPCSSTYTFSTGLLLHVSKKSSSRKLEDACTSHRSCQAHPISHEEKHGNGSKSCTKIAP